MSRNPRELQTYLDFLIDHDYRERPVDVVTFVKDEYYLGKMTQKGQLIYPCWIDALEKIFSDDSKPVVVLTGAIGIGKSWCAIIAMLYIMYKLMCLKDAWGYHTLAPGGKMAIVFFNLTKSLGESRGFAKFQSYMLESPWFLERKTAVVRGQKDVRVEFPLFRYLLASPYCAGFGTQGEDVIMGIMDEVDSPTSSQKQKIRVLKAYENTVTRFKSRFMINSVALGRLFLVSSKQDDLSFIETFVAKMKLSGSIQVFDIPFWEAKPKAYFSGITFPIAIGDAYHPPRIIEEADRTQHLQDGWSEIIDAPAEYRADAMRDLKTFLRDVAGKSIAGERKTKLFASDSFIKDCMDDTLPKPEKVGRLDVGLKDEDRWIFYLDLAKMSDNLSAPRYIHLDIGITGDCLGLAMARVDGWKEINALQQDGSYSQTKAPVVRTDFVLRAKAREQDRIPIHKMRELVLDLKAFGFNIVKFTADLRMASEDTLQILNKAGIKSEYFSVDRTDKAYVDFRNLIYEGRWKCHKHDYLLFELRHLEHHSAEGKVDHPDEVMDVEYLEDGDCKEVVMMGTKDAADAVCGSVMSCIYEVQVPLDSKELLAVFERLSNSAVDTVERGVVLRDGEGKDIVGVVTRGGNIEQINKIFKKLM